ncbi:hypothetical protein [Actinoallomurus rhizosphaericola]|uniref:hypothetical protein n=1 Tax=Actinoallomurus rhizosphaericola TaxID=2952536 RepID=UPI002093D53B|nr:hypothetical protein [Actinoallomurus rhizosphaericola]MCO5998625.1 hypothetical protein [Actinoallomurus rhizosphaericola]
MATSATHVDSRLTGTPWTVRLGRSSAGRPALEVYDAETLVDVVVETPVAPETLRGARRGVSPGGPCAVAWGRLPATTALPEVLFAGWTRRCPADVFLVGGFCWLAVAHGRFTTVRVNHRGDACGRLRIRGGRRS